MKRNLVVSLLASLCVFASLPSAHASLHADLTPLVFLLLPIAIFREGAPFALLLAAFFFWRKQRSGWLFTCVAVPVCLGLLVRLFIFATITGNPNSGIRMENLPFVYAVVDWLLLLTAFLVKKPISPQVTSGR